MFRYNFSHITTSSTKTAYVDHGIGKKTLRLSGTGASSTQIEQTLSEKMLNDAKHIVTRLKSKASNEPIKQERVTEPQVLEQQEVPHLSMEIIIDKVQPLKETDSLSSNDVGMSKEAITSTNDINKRSMCEEKIFSEIREKKQTLEELKVHMDEYHPIPPHVANIKKLSEEEDFRKDFARERSHFLTFDSLSSNFQPPTYKNAMKNMRGTKNNIRKLLYQLYETIELTYRRKQRSEDQQNYYKALFELWIKWSKNQPENEDEDDIELLELLILDMSRIITLKLQSAFMDLIPKVQGLPSNLQDKLQQACRDMQDLHTMFSLSNGFEDLDKHRLTQSQYKLTQAQGSLEKLYCFLEGNVEPIFPL
ncbi:perilipin-2-like [Sminthopsis crassicaudata]|uniref:perilipin-2-like n=1 Tax=Sminthopsis crassicaudata TaxID=9301 RepID=UPI003D690874